MEGTKPKLQSKSNKSKGWHPQKIFNKISPNKGDWTLSSDRRIDRRGPVKS